MKEDRYKELIKDIKNLEGNTIRNKYAQGKRILKDYDKSGKPKYGSKRIEDIAIDTKISARELYRCIQFARQYKESDIDTCVKMSWREIIKTLQVPRRPKAEIIDFPKGKYKVIYADPPWQYDRPSSFQPENHYPTMSNEEIAKLPVSEITQKNAVLFLWIPTPKKMEAREIYEAWGFEYKTEFIWDKVKSNFGYYNKANHETLLMCTRGSCLPAIKFDSVFSKEKTKHSEKPEEFRKMIEKMCPHCKRVELFATKEVKGWTCWGNEIENKVEEERIEKSA